jgi:hypothetical protein
VYFCIKNVEVLELPYGEVGVNSKISVFVKIEGSHSAFDVVEGIIAQNGSQTKSGLESIEVL